MDRLSAQERELVNELIDHVCYLDSNPPPTPLLWLIVQQLRTFREYAAWVADLRSSEHSPSSPSSSS